MTQQIMFSPDLEKPLPLPAVGSWPASIHRFDSQSIWAIRAALGAGRPLLLRGEPGIGKSQLARAAATELGVSFYSHVVDERTERDDLLYRYDAVSRLALAQVAGVSAGAAGADDWKEDLAERRFLLPGVLWWAFDAASAKKQLANHFRDSVAAPSGYREATEGEQLPCSSVVLIDEIDKADPSVPNGLLEALGNLSFDTPLLDTPVVHTEGMRPLVIVTTNEERELPPAFLRRCLVLQQNFPEDSQAGDLLLQRAQDHWPNGKIDEGFSSLITEEIVPLLLRHREKVLPGMPKPGLAEFLDIVRALVELYPEGGSERDEAFSEISTFALRKA